MRFFRGTRTLLQRRLLYGALCPCCTRSVNSTDSQLLTVGSTLILLYVVTPDTLTIFVLFSGRPSSMSVVRYTLGQRNSPKKNRQRGVACRDHVPVVYVTVADRSPVLGSRPTIRWMGGGCPRDIKACHSHRPLTSVFQQWLDGTEQCAVFRWPALVFYKGDNVTAVVLANHSSLKRVRKTPFPPPT